MKILAGKQIRLSRVFNRRLKELALTQEKFLDLLVNPHPESGSDPPQVIRAQTLLERFPERFCESDIPKEKTVHNFCAAQNHHDNLPTFYRAINTRFVDLMFAAVGLDLGDFIDYADSKVIPLDPTLEPEGRAKVLRLMRRHQEETGEMIGLDSFLPCSLVPLNFMRAHHEALYADQDPFVKEEVVAAYNEIGEAQNARLRTTAASERLKQIQLNFEGDLRDIAEGNGVYASMSAGLRKEGLEYVRSIVADPAWRVSLIIGEAHSAPELQTLFQTFDTLLVCGRQFVMLRHRNTSVLRYTEMSDQVLFYREKIDRFMQKARWSDPPAVIRKLSELISSIPS